MYEDKRPEAATEYITNNKSINAIAQEMGIGRSTVARWAKDEKWKEQREKMHRRAVKRATTAQVKKEAKKLQTLTTAANKAERALSLAAGLVESALEEINKMPEINKNIKAAEILNGYALKNLQSLADAIGSQTKTAFMLRGMLTEAEKRKLEVEKKKLALEEKKISMDAEAETENAGGWEVKFPPELEAIMEGKRRHEQ